MGATASYYVYGEPPKPEESFVNVEADEKIKKQRHLLLRQVERKVKLRSVNDRIFRDEIKQSPEVVEAVKKTLETAIAEKTEHEEIQEITKMIDNAIKLELDSVLKNESVLQEIQANDKLLSIKEPEPPQPKILSQRELQRKQARESIASRRAQRGV